MSLFIVTSLCFDKAARLHLFSAVLWMAYNRSNASHFILGSLSDTMTKRKSVKSKLQGNCFKSNVLMTLNT